MADGRAYSQERGAAVVSSVSAGRATLAAGIPGFFDKILDCETIGTCGYLVRPHDRNDARWPDQPVSGPKPHSTFQGIRTGRATYTSAFGCFGRQSGVKGD